MYIYMPQSCTWSCTTCIRLYTVTHNMHTTVHCHTQHAYNCTLSHTTCTQLYTVTHNMHTTVHCHTTCIQLYTVTHNMHMIVHCHTQHTYDCTLSHTTCIQLYSNVCSLPQRVRDYIDILQVTTVDMSSHVLT